MRRLLASLALVLALAVPAAASLVPYMAPTSWQSIGRRFYLARYGLVTLEAHEEAYVFLSLAGCPGGVDHVFAYYIQRTTPGDVSYDIEWGYPHAYNGYIPGMYLEFVNHSDEPVTLKIKLDVRCDE